MRMLPWRAQRERMAAGSRRMLRRHAFLYALLGGALGFGAPTGLLLLRCVPEGTRHLASSVIGELSGDPALYAYVTIGSIVVMAAFGATLGLQEDRVRAMSFVDALTGLYNRRLFDRRLGEEIARTQRYGAPLSLLIVDLDRFKQVNDRFGHVRGDAVLRLIATLVKDGFRATDTVCRYGGEEIAIIAPSTTLSQAHVLAERARERIQQTVIPLEGEPYRITVSIGIAQRLSRESADALTDRADAALYEAKRRGRNRTQLSVLAGGDPLDRPGTEPSPAPSSSSSPSGTSGRAGLPER